MLWKYAWYQESSFSEGSQSYNLQLKISMSNKQNWSQTTNEKINFLRKLAQSPATRVILLACRYESAFRDTNPDIFTKGHTSGHFC